MNKDVMVSVRGVQYLIDTNEKTEPIKTYVPGEYYYKNGKHYVVYEETAEGMTGVVKNRLKITEDCIELKKTGLVNALMIFEVNKMHETIYQTPYGGIAMGIFTDEIDLDVSDDQLEAKVEYCMDMNGHKVADCEIRLLVK